MKGNLLWVYVGVCWRCSVYMFVCVPYPFCAVNLNYGLAGNNGRSCLIFLSTSVRLLGWLELWIVLLAWVGVRCCCVCVWFGGIILLLGFPAWCDRVCVCGDWIEDWCYLTLGLLCLSMLYQFFVFQTKRRTVVTIDAFVVDNIVSAHLVVILNGDILMYCGCRTVCNRIQSKNVFVV